MRAYQLTPGQGLASLEATTRPRRALEPHQVRVAVRAVSLNYREILICRGDYPAPTDRAVVPCSDGAGTVVEVGAAAAGVYTVGDQVVGSFFPHWRDGAPTPEAIAVTAGCNVDGWLAEEVVADPHALVRIPAGLSHATAACVPCAGVTAWVAMFEAARLQRRATMLIQGTGGVSMWAARLAEASGVKTVVISSDPAKAASIQTPGGLTVNYRERPDWSEEVLRWTGGRGVDLVLELGGQSTIRESLRALAFRGQVAVIGGLGGWTYESMEYLQLITKMATLHGLYVGSAKSLADLLAFVQQHQLQPHVSARFAWSEAPAAFQALAAGRHVGKIVIDVA